MLALFKKESIQFEDLILAFPVSVGISALLTLGLLYIGVQVEFIFHMLYGIMGLSIILYVIKYRKVPSLSVEITGREIRFIIIAFLVTLMFCIPLLSDRTLVSAHGFHHSTIVTQILNGIFPPENPGLGGKTLSYHWGYHAFVATISSPSGLPPLKTVFILNVMSLFMVFCIAYRSADYFELDEGYRYLVALALIGMMRSDSIIFIVNKFFFGSLISLRQISFSELGPMEIIQDWIWGGGAPWFDRRLFFISKFYNANSMPLGMAVCFSYFLFLLKSLKKTCKYKSRTIYIMFFGLLIVASCIIYPPLAIVLLLHAPVWAGITILLKRADLKKGFKESLQILVPYSLAILMVLPYLLSVSSNTGEPIIRINFYDQSIINLVAFWLPMPLIIIGAVFSFRKITSEIFTFMIVAVFLCFGLSTFTQIALGNSVKFTFVLSLFYALFFVYGVSCLMKLISKQWLKTFLLASVIIALLITPIITEAGYVYSKWFHDNTYTFSGRHIVFSQDSKRNEAYAWIRDNTPPESLIMLSYIDNSHPYNIAHNTIYEPAALTERNLFVIKDWYTLPDTEYKRRVNIREKLLLSQRDADVSGFLASLKQPVYLLVEDKLSPIYLRDEVFNNFPGAVEGFTLLFNNERQQVYLLQE